MRSVYQGVFCMVVVVIVVFPSAAELQSVAVGGQLRIRGNYWRNSFSTRTGPVLVGNNIRWNANVLGGRPIGDPVAGQTIVSFFDWDDAGQDYSVIEQRTRLNIRAEFTEQVAAFIELDSFEVWGEDFRSQNYVTGLDVRQNSADDVEVYQAYVDADELFGWPVRLRVGRQELSFGKGWLVGNNSNHPEFAGVSFDAVRLTYTNDPFTLDAFGCKLVERSPAEGDGDTDFYGIYASYHPLDVYTLDAYWFLVRDAAARRDTNGGALTEWLESQLGLDDYEVTYLHTIGLRFAGDWHGLDYEVETAYQLGDASAVGFFFKPYGYGDNRASFNAWAAEAEVGYTFEAACAPRIYLGGAYFYGEDNRDISFWEWLNPLAPFLRPDASVSFNRLFSNTVHSYFIDEMGELSNFWTLRGGINAHPTQAIETGLNIACFGVVDRFELPLHIWFDGRRVPLFSPLSFLTQTAAGDIGWELDLWAQYHYSDDLTFKAGWSHLFTGGALHDGNFNDLNGMLNNAGTDDQDADYFYLEAEIWF
jgi:hypothetical protein